mgnify:CR=1 FL=1
MKFWNFYNLTGLKTQILACYKFCKKIADEAGFDKPVAELSDEVIIYHLKMHGTDKLEPIPGIKKDYEEDYGISSSYVCNGNSYFRSRRGDKCNSSLQHECKDV